MTQEPQQGSSVPLSPGSASLEQFSDQLASIAWRVGPSIVRVDDGSRLTASGIVWPSADAADAIVAATSHGVEDDGDNGSLCVESADGVRYPAVVVGRDPESDLAVLRVAGAATALPPAALASPEQVAVGQIALALARPGDSGLRATLGIVSARHDAVENGRGEYIVHTDATLYPGSSGGALVDARGRVIGLLNLAFRRTGGVALGADMVSHVAESLLTNGTVRRGHLGVGTQTVSLASAHAASGGEEQSALLVVHVEPGSPAEKSGLIVGDVLMAIADKPLGSRHELRAVLRHMVPGMAVKITLLRGGAPTEVLATLGEEQ